MNYMSKPAVINVKITDLQRNWLAETSRKIRDNNIDPVPPSERVYPQHLLGVAIDLLMNAEIDWQQVRNIEELRKELQL